MTTQLTDVQFWVSVASPFLVLIGWFVVYGDSNRIAKRSEAYSIITKTIDKVLALDKRCADYWLAEDNKVESANKWIAGTLSEIHGVRTLLEMLEDHHEFKDKNELLVSIRMAATLNAEKKNELSIQELKAKKQEQSKALNNTMKSLYAYYRQAHN
jgi:hypothetical protein